MTGIFRKLTSASAFLILGLGASLVLSAIGQASSTRLDVCHIPPGDPLTYHTITINSNAMPAHQAHGDLLDSCNSLCADLCDDGDACTIDDTGDCEVAGCPLEREFVDCDDSNECTFDSCSSVDGVCVNEQVVFCEPSDLCHIASCDPLTGGCSETEKICDAGEVCNLDTGQCETEEPPTAAPAFTSFSVVSISSATITFQWTTDIPATSQLYFRRQDIGSFELGANNAEFVTDHLIVLPTPLGDGLISNTNYEIFARSESASGSFSDSDVILVRTRR